MGIMTHQLWREGFFKHHQLFSIQKNKEEEQKDQKRRKAEEGALENEKEGEKEKLFKWFSSVDDVFQTHWLFVFKVVVMKLS